MTSSEGADERAERQRARAGAWTHLAVAVLLIGFAAVLSRVVQLKIAPGEQLRTALPSRETERVVLARRGDVIDGRGRLIATSTVGHKLFVDPTMVEDPDTIAVDLARLTGLDPLEIGRLITERRSKRYAVIAPLIDGDAATAVRNAALKGVGLQERLVRHYPHGDVAASVIGLVGIDHDGLGGVEYALQDTLAQEDGHLTFVRDASRRAFWIEPEQYHPGHDGEAVQLTIDIVIQEMAERVLRAAVSRYDAAGGRIVVLDPQSGDLLAMADVINTETLRETFLSDASRARHAALGRNRCATDPYEPGSTFKPIVWAVATDLGLARPDEIIPTPLEKYYRTSQNRRIRDTRLRGPVPWRDVLVHSLNSGMAIVAERLTHTQLQAGIEQFGIGRPTQSGVPGESAGIVADAEHWTHYTQTSVPMGHEVAVTPLQMVRAFSVFARDGTVPALRLTTGRDPEYRFSRRACTEDVSLTVREVLREVVTTSGRAASSIYQLFGKSGTAQLPRPEGGGYFEDRYVSSFIAGAPLEDPRLIVLCVIDDPDRSIGHWGSAVAGPVVRDVMDSALLYMGVPSDAPAEVAMSVDLVFRPQM